MSNRSFEIRPYTLKDLAAIYRVDKKTFVVWITPFEKEIGQRVGRIYQIAQVEVIASKLGWPYYYQKN